MYCCYCWVVDKKQLLPIQTNERIKNVESVLPVVLFGKNVVGLAGGVRAGFAFGGSPCSARVWAYLTFCVCSPFERVSATYRYLPKTVPKGRLTPVTSYGAP